MGERKIKSGCQSEDVYVFSVCEDIGSVSLVT